MLDRPDDPMAQSPLLGAGDPPVFDHLRRDGKAPLVIICDHAGRAIPEALGDLGLATGLMDRHIAYDIGADAVARRLSDRLDAEAIVHRYSRLVVDCNRPLGHPESIVRESDRVPVPGNRELTEDEAIRRIDALFWPYHQRISNAIGHRWYRDGRPPALFSVHSFTPAFGDEHRPWDAGVLYNRDPRIAEPMIAALREQGLHIGDNQPYSGLETAYSIDVHGTAAGIANGVIEIRQDQVADEDGIERWAGILADALGTILEREDILRVQRF